MATSATFAALVDVARDCLAAYVTAAERGEGPVVDLRPPAAFGAELELTRWMTQGGMDADALASWLPRYLAATTHLHHPHYIGHQVAVTRPATAVADLVNGVCNNGMAIHEMGPPAVALELAVLAWMGRWLGWEQGHDGVLTHGGSLANLTALAAARAAAAPRAWQEGVPATLRLLAPASSHYSVARAAGILGLGTAAVVGVEVDSLGRIHLPALAAAGDQVEAEGGQVMAVVANACATATGLHDDLDAIGRLCRARGWWFHVDAAHGASALLSPKYRQPLKGIAQADSVVWDAHKMLGVSALCAAVLVREEGRLAAAFQQDANYLGDAKQRHGPDLFHRAIECTKVPLALKLFLNLAIHGEASLRERVETCYDRAREFAELLAADERTTLLCAPQSNILCFRFGGQAVDQRRLRERLIDGGTFYITATTIAGQDWLRLTVMNPLTTVDHLRTLLAELSRLSRE